MRILIDGCDWETGQTKTSIGVGINKSQEGDALVGISDDEEQQWIVMRLTELEEALGILRGRIK